MFWLGLAFAARRAVHAAAETTERIEWKKTLIRLELTVGQERQVAFPVSVRGGSARPTRSRCCVPRA